MAAALHDDQEDHGQEQEEYEHGYPLLSVGFDASEWTTEQLVAYASRSPIQVSLDQVSQGLDGLGLPPEVRQAMLAVLTCTAAHHDPHGQRSTARVASVEAISDQAVLAAAHGTRVLAGFAEGALIEAARTLADRAGQELLARKHATDPAELSSTARAKWRATTKSLVAQELSTLTGHGIHAAHTIVAFALAPPTAVTAATTALRTGKTDWRAVSAFWSRCATFEHTAAADVDTAVFGPLLDHPTPEDITHPEHITDPDQPGDSDSDSAGGQDVRRECWAEFSRRLEREATRAESADHAAARQRRRAALSRRDAHARIGDHGSGEVILTGASTRVAAAIERLETIARAAKAAGDPRSLGQILSDTGYALLIHGILPLPGTSTNCTGTCTGTTDTTPTSTAAPAASQANGSTTGDTGRTTGSATGSTAGSAFSAEPLIATPEDISRIITGQPAISVEVIVPASFLTGHPPTHNPNNTTSTGSTGATPARARPGGVGEIIGYGFLSGEHAQELVLTPGSTLHRLLTDPADGRLIERTITAYRPDHTMITQLRATDVFCRAPGCLVPARRCDLDHEHEHGTGGPTAEPNLGHKHRPHHQAKTARFWATLMNTTRDVTWTTLFARMYTTRPHDYRQYDPPPGNNSPGGWVDPADITDPDTRDQLIYAALSTRTGHDQWLEAIDDTPHAWTPGHDRPITLFHHAGGRRRPGPPPGQPTPDQLINPTPPPAPDYDPPPF